VKSSVILTWILGTVLAIRHLLFLAGDRHPPGFWTAAAGLLFCYSLPFFLLWWIRIPEQRSSGRSVTRALFVIIFAVSLWIPVRRFLPGYRPVALEGLAYFFIPMLECGLIALFLFCRSVIRGLTQKK